ncbi:MAG: S1C family serine protease [Candidatus Bathyarchaeia archaeon]|jgi:S1-C subfamily serine protease
MTENNENQNVNSSQPTENPQEQTPATNKEETLPPQDQTEIHEEYSPFWPNNASPPPPPPSSPLFSPQPHQQKQKKSRVVIVTLLAICLLAGSFIGYAATYSSLNGKISDLQVQLQYYQSSGQNGVDTVSSLNNSASLASLYQNVKASVVIVKDLVPQYNMFGFLAGYSIQQGSGFVTTVNGQQVIVTNNHVIESSTNITVTFADGSSYTASILGSDPYADLAVLKADEMPSGVPSLSLVSSSTLNVGDTVVAVGSPYGLSGTLTTGIISALGRTIVEGSSTSGIAIPDTIQTSTEINPGNSGGPLINLQGQVVGITTAAVSDSQGLGFAIPSDTIMREIVSLVNTGEYTQHPSLNAAGTDMNLQIAQAMDTDVTYGWLVESASEGTGLEGGNTQATVLGERVIIGGDIIIGAGNTAITNTDDLLAYLERNTLPGQNVQFTIIRDGQQQTVTVEIGSLN